MRTLKLVFSIFTLIATVFCLNAINKSSDRNISSTPGMSTLTFKNWGIFNNVFDSHIHADEAWTLTKGSKKVVVAIVDTGIDGEHPELKPNLWKDPKTGNYGWDFTTNKPNPTDSHGHGTHIAGIIGAISNKEKGISGVAQDVSLMILKYYDPEASGNKNLENAVKAIEWAVDHGAHIINYSGGGAEYSDIEYKAIKKAHDKGVLVVAAAGNERTNIDKKENHYYPASYDLDNIISVGGIDINGKILSCSNYGKKKVFVAAPGERIYSTMPGKTYGFMTGTSQATAFVSGLAALIAAKNDKLSPNEIRKIIISSVDPLNDLKDKIASGGKINAFSAIKTAMNIKGIGLGLGQAESPGAKIINFPSKVARGKFDNINEKRVEKIIIR